MTGADIIMAWVTDEGKGHLLDMYAEANGAPVEDTSQDVQLISATESNGITTIVFSRSLDTCDEERDNVILSSTTRLIYAYKDSDPRNNSVSSSDYHGSSTRGVRSVYLLESTIPVPDLPDDVLTYDMFANNYSIPETDTIYYCTFFNPPPLATKHHIVAIKTMVTPGNEGVVHHAVLYGCWGLDKEHIRNNNKTEGVCQTPEMPEFADECRTMVYAWAIGGGKYYYPEVAGFPIGGDDGSAPDYYMMEMHYDNPSLSSNWTDSSGFRLIYTPTLRSMDMGYFPAGSTFGITAPPRPDKFRAVGYCDSSCTSQWVPEEGVHIVNYFLHAHLLGVGIRVDWFRNGEYLGVLAEDASYDFNFQETRNFEEPTIFLPGDALKVTCTYSDSTRDHVTYGGESTRAEMCLAFLSYYPQQNSTTCMSLPNLLVDPTDSVYTSLSLNATIPNSSYANIKVLSQVDDWSPDAVDALQEAVEKSYHHSFCYATSTGGYPTNFQLISASDYIVEEKEKVNFCKTEEPSRASQQMVSFSVILLVVMHMHICIIFTK